MSIELGRLQRVDLRTAWQTEDGDFTNWLAQEENLVLLGDTLGLELELEGTEQGVGPFRIDILCKDTADSSWVIIENQLEKTDHDHLGKLLTYAAGKQALTVVWIAREFTDEHRAALDWLNEITGERHNYFGLEIELWRIGDSPLAPKFNVVSKPNDWTKAGAGSGRGTATPQTETQSTQLAYWTDFMAFLGATGGSVKARKPLPQHWCDFAIGKSGFWLTSAVNTKSGTLTVGLGVENRESKEAFLLLQQQREEIEAEFGETLEWRELPHRKQSRIVLTKPECSITDRTQWPAQHEWLAEKLEKLHRVFAPRVKALNLGEGLEPDDDEGPGGESG